jgi:hypothetical protein
VNGENELSRKVVVKIDDIMNKLGENNLVGKSQTLLSQQKQKLVQRQCVVGGPLFPKINLMELYKRK